MLTKLSSLPETVKQYLIVTGSYWAFTLSDGALRMLVVLYFHSIGYSPLEVAMLFLFYEFFGVVTNLFGGWLAARVGLNITLHLGLLLQLIALSLLLIDSSWLSVGYVMCAQALSGIAKDLNKMSAKSSVKLLVAADAQHQLYRWVALLTGSKNALKGAGFFMGALLLSGFGFHGAIFIMLISLLMVFLISIKLLKHEVGKTSSRPKFKDVFSKSSAVNHLSAARFFLFGSRDVWFVVALPVYLQSQLMWEPMSVGALLAGWVILYGVVQACAPRITGYSKSHTPDVKKVMNWTLTLILMPILIAIGIANELPTIFVMSAGLLVYGAVFAVNSSIHSYLIVAFANDDGVSLDVGFYYMANAAGRLVGTVLSGLVYQLQGIEACLIVSSVMILLAYLMTKRLQSQ